MPNPWKAAVIGVGHLGKEHARIYSQLPNVKLVAIADTNETQANIIARKVGTRAVSDYRSLLGEVELVSIATPTFTHADVARECLKARCHVLIEKPMTNSLETAQELVELGKQNNCKIQVGHIERFNPAVIEILQRNLQPVYIEAIRLSPFKFRSGDIGVVLDMMIHDIHILNLLTNSDIERVDAVGINLMGKNEDIANARFTYTCGCVANVTASRASLKAMRQVRIFTPDTYVSLDYGTMQGRIVKKPAGVDFENINLQKTIPEMFLGLTFEEIFFKRILQVEELKMTAHEPLFAEIQSFVRSVEENTRPIVSGEDGLKAIHIATMVMDDIKKNLSRAQKRFGMTNG